MKFHVSVLIIIYLSPIESLYDEIHQTPEGTIQQTIFEKTVKKYKIQQPNHTTITIRILRLVFKKCNEVANNCCDNNHIVISTKTTNTKFCASTISKWTSLPGPIIEVAVVNEIGNTEFWLEYTTRHATECPNHEFQCIDKKDCYNSSQICDGKFACVDHSDEVGCSRCMPHWTACDDKSSICFDTKTQRCNGMLDCPKGDDEVGCTKSCNATSISCLNNNTCISPAQLCDGKDDCRNMYDELSCMRQSCKSPFYFLCQNGACIEHSLVGNAKDDCGDLSDEMNLYQIICTMLLATSILMLTAFFTTLIVRWCVTRRDIHRLLQDLPEFPLPPFQAPGERDSQEPFQMGFSESDFRVGGDVYEAFVRSRRRIDDEYNKGYGDSRTATRSRSSNVNARNSEEGDIEIIKALVSLSLPHRMCIGLDGYFLDLITDNKPNLHWQKYKKSNRDVHF